MSDVETQPAGGNPGKGRGPPDGRGPPGKGKGSPGNGRGPPEGVPPGKNEHPVQEVRDKFESILDESIGQGRLGLTVYDENGDEKNRVEYIRINGEGSVEAWKFDETQGQTLSPEAESSQWALRRRDKLDQ